MSLVLKNYVAKPLADCDSFDEKESSIEAEAGNLLQDSIIHTFEPGLIPDYQQEPSRVWHPQPIDIKSKYHENKGEEKIHNNISSPFLADNDIWWFASSGIDGQELQHGVGTGSKNNETIDTKNKITTSHSTFTEISNPTIKIKQDQSSKKKAHKKTNTEKIEMKCKKGPSRKARPRIADDDEQFVEIQKQHVAIADTHSNTPATKVWREGARLYAKQNDEADLTRKVQQAREKLNDDIRDGCYDWYDSSKPIVIWVKIKKESGQTEKEFIEEQVQLYGRLGRIWNFKRQTYMAGYYRLANDEEIETNIKSARL